MNPDIPTPREEIETKITALLLGELAADEAFALGRNIEKDPELAGVYLRLQETLGFVREAIVSDKEQPSVYTPPLKLSAERREKLLAQFKTVKPAQFNFPETQTKHWVVRIAAAGAAIFLIISVTIPNFVKTRTASASNAIINNLRQLDGAKQQWALENHKSETDQPTMADLAPYLKGGLPAVAGEQYAIGKVGDLAFADLKTLRDSKKITLAGHKLEEGRSFEKSRSTALTVNYAEKPYNVTPVQIALPNQSSKEDRQNNTPLETAAANNLSYQPSAQIVQATNASSFSLNDLAKRKDFLSLAAGGSGRGGAAGIGKSSMTQQAADGTVFRRRYGPEQGTTGVQSSPAQRVVGNSFTDDPPWLGLPDKPGVASAKDFSADGKDPSAFVPQIAIAESVPAAPLPTPDANGWNFPSAKYPNIGLLGRTTPGTPWGADSVDGLASSSATATYDNYTKSRLVTQAPQEPVKIDENEAQVRDPASLVTRGKSAESRAFGFDWYLGNTLVRPEAKPAEPPAVVEQKLGKDVALNTAPTRPLPLPTMTPMREPLFEPDKHNASNNVYDLNVVGYVSAPVAVTNASSAIASPNMEPSTVPAITLTGITSIRNKRVLLNAATQSETLTERQRQTLAELGARVTELNLQPENKADLSGVLKVYSELVDRKVVAPSNLPSRQIAFAPLQTLTKNDAVQALDAVLALNNISMVSIGDKLVKAVPSAQANQTGSPMISQSEPMRDESNYVTHVFQLQHTRPSDLIDILKREFTNCSEDISWSFKGANQTNRQIFVVVP